MEVRRKRDRVMAIVLTLGREVMRITCAYGPQSERPDTEKVRFMTKWQVSGTWEVLVKSSFLWEISLDMWKNVLRVLKVYMGEMVLGKEMQKEDCWSSVMKNALYAANN